MHKTNTMTKIMIETKLQIHFFSIYKIRKESNDFFDITKLCYVNFVNLCIR